MEVIHSGTASGKCEISEVKYLLNLKHSKTNKEVL